MNSQKDDKDEFEFSFLAENIANDISSSFDLQTSSPPIINIRGTWGLGKSFLAKQIKENLTAKNIKVVTIDAWLVNDQKGIFKYISSELLSKWQNFHFRLSSIKGAIPKVIQPTIVILLFYFTVLFLYNEIFNVTGCNFPYCVIDLKKVLGYLFQFNAALLSFVFVYLIDKDQREPYQLKKFLKDNYKEKTVVIFDEVDRLEAEQIKYLIMMATDALSLKNICPVLCYDYDVVIKKLKEDDKSDELAQKYLNKIEDKIIYVPHIERHHLEKILDKSLSSVENQIGQLIKPEDIEMILEDNIISGNRRIFFQYIQAIKKKLPILETTINLAEMLSFLLRIEKLKLNNYALYSWILQFVLSEETKRFRSSVFDKDRQENFIPEVLKKEKLFVTSSEEIQRLTKKLLETPQHLINEYYEFTVYGKRKCNLTIIQIENLCEQLVKYNGEDINADQLCEVLQRFNYLLERSKKLSLLKDPFFQAIRKIIFDPESESDKRFIKFFDQRINYWDLQGNAFLLLIRNYNYLLFQSKTHEDICQTIRKDLNDTYDPRIIHELLNHGEVSQPQYLPIIKDGFKDHIQNRWLNNLKLGKMLKPAFYQCLWDILALWKSYSLDTEFMTQFIDIHPEMSLQIISDYMSKSRTSSERPYILVEKASVNNEDKILGKIFNIALYNLQDFNNLNTLGIDFKKALYGNIKKSIPEELFSLLSRSELDNSRLFFHEELYNRSDSADELYYPSLTHRGVMFCLIYEESELKA